MAHASLRATALPTVHQTARDNAHAARATPTLLAGPRQDSLPATRASDSSGIVMTGPQPIPGRWGPVGWSLPVGSLLAGLILLSPWLIWAPWMAGICLGILLVQCGLLQRWLLSRSDLRVGREPSAGPPDSDVVEPRSHEDRSSRPEHRADLDDPTMPEAFRPKPRRAHSGWPLIAALVLMGIQAALLLATVRPESIRTAPHQPLSETRAKAPASLDPADLATRRTEEAREQAMTPQ